MFLGQIQSPVAKRVGIRVRRRRGSHILRSGEHRAFGAPMNRNCTLWTLRVAWLKAFSLLRFFVALDKVSMTSVSSKGWPRDGAKTRGLA